MVNLVCGGVFAEHALLVSDLRVVVGVLRLDHDSLVEHLESLFQDLLSSAAVSSEELTHVKEEVAVSGLIELHGLDELIELLLNILNVVLSSQEIEAVDPEGLNVLSVLDKHLLDCLKSLLPVAVDHMDLGLFKESWEKVLVLNRDLRKCLQSEIILLLLLLDFCPSKHALEVLNSSWLSILKSLLEVLSRLHLELLFWSG